MSVFSGVQNEPTQSAHGPMRNRVFWDSVIRHNCAPLRSVGGVEGSALHMSLPCLLGNIPSNETEWGGINHPVPVCVK